VNVTESWAIQRRTLLNWLARAIASSRQVYNTILRRFPADKFKLYSEGNNLFSTSICALVSAIVKVSRVVKLAPSTPLYRGLGGTTELPKSFFKVDEHGCWGFMEWGLMSTTTSLETAVQFSGAMEDKPLPMVLPPPPLLSLFFRCTP
jgi:hypothetical protein